MKEWYAQYQLPGREPFWFGGVRADDYEQAVKAACKQKRKFFTEETKLIAISPGHGFIEIKDKTPVAADACCHTNQEEL